MYHRPNYNDIPYINDARVRWWASWPQGGIGAEQFVDRSTGNQQQWDSYRCKFGSSSCWGVKEVGYIRRGSHGRLITVLTGGGKDRHGT